MNTKTQATLALTADYGQTVEALVKAGKYDYANSSITSQNFPTSRKGQANLEAVLVNFGRYLNSEEALTELGKKGLRAGELHELLALGAQHPNEQRQDPIVALGSVWRHPLGDRNVPYLWSDGSDRDLGLNWFGLRWSSDDRFLAFRK